MLTAVALGFVPAVAVQSPVQAAPGDVTMSVAEIEGTEGDSLVFEIRRETPANLGALPFTVSAGGGTATAGVDYQTPATPLPFAATTTAGDQLKRISVRTLDDPYDEADTEDFFLTIVVNPGPNQYTITGHGIIDDDDAVPTVNLSTTASIAENGGNATVTATLSAASSFDVSIPVRTTAGSATAGSDYTALGGTATIDIPHGQTTGTVLVPVIDDGLDETTETFTVSVDTNRTLSPVGHLLTGTDSVTVSIIDNDGTPVVSVGGGGVAVEGTPLRFTVNLNKPSASPVTVRVSTTDGPGIAATTGSDYTARTNLLVTIPAGQVTASVDIATLDDARDEAVEILTFTAALPTGATLGTASITAGISDDDDAPTATMTVPTITETDVDATATFTVGLDVASDQTATVGYTVGVNGSGVGFATAGTDFTVTTGTLTFAPGDVSETFDVTIKGDTIDEGTGETFKVALSNADQTVANAGSIGTDTVVTLADDDTAPMFSVADVTRAEGNPAGGVVADNAAFTVTLNHASDRAIDFVVSLADGTAVEAVVAAGSDDVDAPTATVTIPALSTTATVNVPVNRDTLFEADETATLTVTLAPGETDATGGPDVSTLTLTNDDAAPTITLNSATAAEGATVAVIATVTGVSQSDTVFDLAKTGDNSGGNNPAEGGDYTAVWTQGTVPAGTASGSTVTLQSIAFVNDTIDEPTEVVRVTSTNTVGSPSTAFGLYTITDDPADLPPSVSIADVPGIDEDAVGSATVTVSLAFTAPTTATEQTVVVDYTTANGTALAGADYTTTTGQLTFAPGDTSETISVPVTDDLYKENAETVLVNLSSATPAGVVIDDDAATLTIDANDPGGQVTFSVANVSQVEGNAGTTTATFTVTLSAQSVNPIDFDVTIADGTAEEAIGIGAGRDDYDAPNATVTVPDGQLSETFDVPVNGDTVFEGNETATVTVTLDQAEVDAYGDPDDSTLTLTNDDTVPTITLNSASAAEGSSVDVIATVVGSSQSDTVFNLAVAPDSVSGNPAEAADYTAVWTQGTVPGRTVAGATVTLRTIAFAADSIDEPDEFLTVTSTSTAGAPSTVAGVYTITDDAADVTPTVAVADETVDESNGPATVDVSLVFSPGVTATEKQILVGYTTADGTALVGSDYTTTSGQLTFAPGDILKTVNVPILSDLDPEPNQTFLVTVTSPDASVSDGSATVTITDNRPTFSVANESQAEGDAPGTATFTVTMVGTSPTPVDFTVAIADGTAVDAVAGVGSDDYDAPSTTVQVGANQPSQTFTVPVKGDTIYEGDETATVTVTLAPGETDATGGPDVSTLTLTNDDLAPTITLNSATAAEGGSVDVIATVTGVSQSNTVFDLAKAGDNSGSNNPAEGADYTAAWTQGTVPAGTPSGTTVTLQSIAFDADSIDEPDEVVRVTSTNTVGAPSTAFGLYTITDDVADVEPTVAVADETVDESTGPATVDVSLVFSGGVTATERQILVDYTTADNDSAVAGSDYSTTSGQLTFIPGDALEVISVPITSDLLPESPETFLVTVTSATVGVSVSDGSATVTITDNRPTFSVANVSQLEGNAPGTASFTVTLSAPSTQPVDFAVAIADGTAEDAGSGAGSNDYNAPSATVQVAANQPSQTFTVPVNGDTVYEADETATVTVTLAPGETDATGGPDASTLTLTNDDLAPTIALNSASAAEGGTVDVIATVTGSSQVATVFNLAVTGDSSGGNNAAESTDYTAAWTQGTIPAGTTPGTTVTLRTIAFDADSIDEPDEVVKVTSTSTVGTPSTVTGLYTITDDAADVTPTVAVADESVDESSGPATVDVSLEFSGGVTATERQILVDYATANGTATAGSDYTATTSQLTFAPGDVLKTISVPVTNDAITESSETFLVTITSPTMGVTVSDGSATVTITENKPTFSVQAVSQDENAGAAVFTVALQQPTTQDVTFAVSMIDGTAVDGGVAAAGGDDFDAPPTTLTILANQPTGTITVPVRDDTIFEADETAVLRVALAASEFDAIGGPADATLTITNDDAVPSIVLNTESGTEGTEVAVVATVTGVAQANTVFSLAVTGDNTGGNDPAEPSDFTDTGVNGVIPGGTASGSAVTLRTIRLNQDSVDEATESFRVVTHDLAGGVVDRSSVYRINDDPSDVPPAVSVGDVSVSEGEAAAVAVTLTFDPDGVTTGTERPVVVNYATVNGSAVAPSDYPASTGSITIAPGVTTGTITVPIVNDDVHEETEDLLVRVTSVSPAGAVILDGAATVTIADNDEEGRPTFSVAAVTQAEDAGPAVFTVTLANASLQPVDLVVGMADGTATDGGTAAGGNDFNPPPATVQVPANSLTATFSVPVNNDAVYEASETATVRVALAEGEADAIGGPSTALLTITDDDAPLSIVLNTESGTEGTEVAVVATVTGVAQADTVFNLAVTGDNTGGNNPAETTDYTDTGVNGVIPGGTPTGSAVTLRTIRLNQDSMDEATETIRVTTHDLVGPVADREAVYRINDDPSDVPPVVSVGDVSVSEGEDAEVAVTLTFDPEGLTTGTERPLVVNYATVNGSAVAPSDYPASTGSITIAPGVTTGTITVPIVNDDVHEETEDLLVRVTSVSPAGAVILDGAATVTIADNDEEGRPTFSVAAVSRAENAGPAVFTVTLANASLQPVDLVVGMADGTATDGGTAAGGNDFNPPPTTVRVPAESLTATFSVPVNNDVVYEGSETATVRVALAEGEADAIGGPSTALLTITDDEAPLSIVLNTESGTEGTEVAVVATVTGVAQADTALRLTLAGDSTGTNDPAEVTDYTDTGVNGVIPGGTASGSAVTLRTIRLNQDTIDEAAEWVRVTTHDLAGHLVDRSSLYRINDDPTDVPPAISLADKRVSEGAGSVGVDVTLAFDPDGDTTATERSIVVNYATANGSAAAPSDYTAGAGSVTFAPDATTGTINIPIVNDTVLEPAESFVVAVTSTTPGGVPIIRGSATVTIDDNDAVAPTLVTSVATRTGVGAVTLSGTTVAGSSVQLWAQPVSGGAYTATATTVADASGNYTFTYSLTTGYRFYTRANGVDSVIRTVTVTQAPVLTATSATTGMVTLTVAGNPKAAGQEVQIQRGNPDGTWNTVASGTTTDGTLVFTTTLTGLTSGTTLSYRAYILANPTRGELAGYSTAKAVTIR